MSEQSQPISEGWREEMELIRDLIAGAPIEALGVATNNCVRWPIRDEVVYRITKCLKMYQRRTGMSEQNYGVYLDDIKNFQDFAEFVVGVADAMKAMDMPGLLIKESDLANYPRLSRLAVPIEPINEEQDDVAHSSTTNDSA